MNSDGHAITINSLRTIENVSEDTKTMNSALQRTARPQGGVLLPRAKVMSKAPIKNASAAPQRRIISNDSKRAANG